jgi:hypothetical protein
MPTCPPCTRVRPHHGSELLPHALIVVPAYADGESVVLPSSLFPTPSDLRSPSLHATPRAERKLAVGGLSSPAATAVPPLQANATAAAYTTASASSSSYARRTSAEPHTAGGPPLPARPPSSRRACGQEAWLATDCATASYGCASTSPSCAATSPPPTCRRFTRNCEPDASSVQVIMRDHVQEFEERGGPNCNVIDSYE